MSARTGLADTATATVVSANPAFDRGASVEAPRSARAAEPSGATSRYHVIGEIGHGGMGVVLRAYDPRLRREVALKMVRTDRLSHEGQARMLREAQAMAMLSHPHVVAVYDVEIVGDHVAMAMEYVRGTNLEHWLTQLGSPGSSSTASAKVVEAFIAAGRGLAAAHAAGLLHRDFKPANVLVGEDGRVRVTDFGIAQLKETARSGFESGGGFASSIAADQSELETEAGSLALTEAGAVLGTPLYMPPEQHEGQELGPAADQYAFCVSLWAGLTGKPPFSGDRCDILYSQKCGGPPPWPRDVAVPHRIGEALRRGLQVDPAARWPSMEALLEVLRLQPKRKRAVFASAAVAVALGISGVALGAWQQQSQLCSGARAQIDPVWNPKVRGGVEQALRRTGLESVTDAWQQHGPKLDRYAEQWTTMHTQTCAATTVRGEQSVEAMDLQMLCLHRAKVDYEVTVDLLARADRQVALRLEQLVGALPDLSRCADAVTLASEVPPPPPELAAAVESARVHLSEARALQQAAKYDEALRRLESLREEAGDLGYEPLQSEVWFELGVVHANHGAYAEAEAALRDALRSGLRWKQWDLAQDAASRLVLTVGMLAARPAEGLAYGQTAKGLLRLSGGLGEARLRNTISGVLYTLGRFAEAEAENSVALALIEKELGPDDVAVSVMRASQGNILTALGRFEEAEAALHSALAVQTQKMGADHPQVAYTRMNLGLVHHAQDRVEEAETELAAALASWERALGPEHVEVALARVNYADVLTSLRRLEEAESQARAALAIWQSTLDPEHPYVAAGLFCLGRVLSKKGRLREGEAQLRAAMALLDRVAPGEPTTAATHLELGELLMKQGRLVEAANETKTAVAAYEELFGPGNVHAREAKASHARVLARLRRPSHPAT